MCVDGSGGDDDAQILSDSLYLLKETHCARKSIEREERGERGERRENSRKRFVRMTSV
jgi:hypothetical protein